MPCDRDCQGTYRRIGTVRKRGVPSGPRQKLKNTPATVARRHVPALIVHGMGDLSYKRKLPGATDKPRRACPCRNVESSETFLLLQRACFPSTGKGCRPLSVAHRTSQTGNKTTFPKKPPGQARASADACLGYVVRLATQQPLLGQATGRGSVPGTPRCSSTGMWHSRLGCDLHRRDACATFLHGLALLATQIYRYPNGSVPGTRHVHP